MSTTYLALLRGINVGGKNRLPMPALTEIFDACGCTQVRTFIQSGNVLFDAAPSVARELPEKVAAHITERFGYRIPVVLRSAHELSDAVAENPYLPMEVLQDTLHVMFLADLPDPVRVALLDPQRSPPDTFVVKGKNVYLYLPHGVAHTRVTNAYIDAKLATVSTMRNWRTVTTLLALMQTSGDPA